MWPFNNSRIFGCLFRKTSMRVFAEWGQLVIGIVLFPCFDQFASLPAKHPCSSVSRQLLLGTRWKLSSQSFIIVARTVTRVRLGVSEVTFNFKAPNLRILTTRLHRAPRTNQKGNLQEDRKDLWAPPPAPPLDNPWKKIHDPPSSW